MKSVINTLNIGNKNVIPWWSSEKDFSKEYSDIFLLFNETQARTRVCRVRGQQARENSRENG